MNCTIIVFHFEALAYLRAIIRQLRKYKHPEIEQKIVIADQSVDISVLNSLYTEFASQPDITIIHTSPYGSGYSVDHVVRNGVGTEFVCTLDVDALPIHKNWLYAPIMLIRNTDTTWVGVHAQIENAYAYMGDFFCMCQHYRVARTETYLDLSLNGGFTKNDHRKRLTFNNNEWHGWSDDAIVAHWWEDKYRTNNKFTMDVSRYLGIAPTEGRYGRYTDDLVFHVGFSYNWTMVRNRKECMGDEYLVWMERMHTQGLSDDLLNEMIAKTIPLESPIPRLCWDGKTKTIHSPAAELNELFNNYKKA